MTFPLEAMLPQKFWFLIVTQLDKKKNYLEDLSQQIVNSL